MVNYASFEVDFALHFLRELDRIHVQLLRTEL